MRKIWGWLFVILVTIFLLTMFVDNVSSDTIERYSPSERAYEFHEPIRINSDDEFDQMARDEGWSGSGTWGSPYIIQNYEIDGNGTTAFYIGNTTRYFIVKFSHFYNFSYSNDGYHRGIVELYNVKNGDVYGCNITDGQYGIYVTTHSSSNHVEYNQFYNVTNGVYLYFYASTTIVSSNVFHYRVHVGTAITIAYNSDNNEVWYNTIDGPATGVYINGNNGACTGNFISRNTITTTRDYSVYVYSSLGSNRVENNTIRDSMDEGIRVYSSSDYTTIVNNSIFNSVNYGIDVHSSDNVLVYNNSLVGNNGATDTYDSSHVQAVNNGSGNQWYHNGYGNYWSDWTSPDDNGDGIVDSPYILEGDSGSQDPYPLVESSHPIPELSFFHPFIIIVLVTLYFVRKR